MKDRVVDLGALWHWPALSNLTPGLDDSELAHVPPWLLPGSREWGQSKRAMIHKSQHPEPLSCAPQERALMPMCSSSSLGRMGTAGPWPWSSRPTGTSSSGTALTHSTFPICWAWATSASWGSGTTTKVTQAQGQGGREGRPQLSTWAPPCLPDCTWTLLPQGDREPKAVDCHHFFKVYLFIYLFLAALGLRCWAGLSLVAVNGGYSSL